MRKAAWAKQVAREKKSARSGHAAGRDAVVEAAVEAASRTIGRRKVAAHAASSHAWNVLSLIWKTNSPTKS